MINAEIKNRFYVDRATIVLEIDIDGAEYLADVMDSEVNRTALAGVNHGRGDGGAADIAEALHEQLAAFAQLHGGDDD